MIMRKLSLAVAAATMAVPTVPTFVMSAPAFAYQSDGYYTGRTWRDSRGRLRCKKKNGTTGLIVGAAGGALVGRAIDNNGSRATGTILGAAAGALLGREIDRSSGNRYRCR
jgi:hypothetical protein